MLSVKQGGTKYYFWVFGMTLSRIEPRSPRPLANTLLIRPMATWWLQCSPMARETWVQSQVESYQRFKKWYLIPPCLTLGIIRYASRVKWSNLGKGVAPFLTLWCSSYRKVSLWVTLDNSRQLYLYSIILFVSLGSGVVVRRGTRVPVRKAYNNHLDASLEWRVNDVMSGRDIMRILGFWKRRRVEIRPSKQAIGFFWSDQISLGLDRQRWVEILNKNKMRCARGSGCQ